MAQTESESESENSSEEMAQIETESETEAEDSNEEMAQMESKSELEEQPTVLVEVGTEAMSQIGDETLDKVAEFLAQLDEPSVKKLDQIFTQLSSGELNFAQTASNSNASLEDAIEVVAQYLAQLNNNQIEELSNLLQTKTENFDGQKHDFDFSQMNVQEGADYLF